MDTAQGYTTVTTKLVSSYAWDTAIDFIQKANSDNEHSDYATSLPEGNYNNTKFDYANIGETEKSSHKNPNEGMLVPTGQTTPVSNIYDMGGNLWEYTTESFSGVKELPHSIRGGITASVTATIQQVTVTTAVTLTAATLVSVSLCIATLRAKIAVPKL